MKHAIAAAAALAAVLFIGATSADAGPRLRFFFGGYDPDYRTYYPGPDYIPRRRYRDDFEDEDEDDERRFYGYLPDDEDEFDEDYYEPEYVPPKKAKKKKSAAKPSTKSVAKPDTKSAATNKSETKKKTQQALSCDKASEIVSGYGFTAVQSTSCSGPVYAFNASRDGKPFTIKMNSASGELTEVKKQK